MKLEETEQKLRSTEAFYQVAKYLRSNPPVALTRGSNAQEELDNQRLWRNMVSHLHYAIIFENTVKILWEVEHKKECSYTHDINKIFTELSSNTQKEIKQIYDEQTKAFRQTKVTMRGKVTTLGKIVGLATFEQALKVNEITIKNFKYDNKFQGKTSVTGNVIWSEDTFWVLPSVHKPFAESLFEYMANKVNKS